MPRGLDTRSSRPGLPIFGNKILKIMRRLLIRYPRPSRKLGDSPFQRYLLMQVSAMHLAQNLILILYARPMHFRQIEMPLPPCINNISRIFRRVPQFINKLFESAVGSFCLEFIFKFF